MPPIARTLIAPRFNDEYSFSGRGRWLYQKMKPAPPLAPPEPEGPPAEGAPVPLRG